MKFLAFKLSDVAIVLPKNVLLINVKMPTIMSRTNFVLNLVKQRRDFIILRSDLNKVKAVFNNNSMYLP